MAWRAQRNFRNASFFRFYFAGNDKNHAISSLWKNNFASQIPHPGFPQCKLCLGGIRIKLENVAVDLLFGKRFQFHLHFFLVAFDGQLIHLARLQKLEFLNNFLNGLQLCRLAVAREHEVTVAQALLLHQN